MAKNITPLETIKNLVRLASSQIEIAKELDISAQYLSDILAGRRGISKKVAEKLGYRKTIVFERL